MNPDEIVEMLSERPFQPILFRFNDGQTELVRHPEMVIVGFDWLRFGRPHEKNPRVADTTKLYSMLNLVSVEAADQTASR